MAIFRQVPLALYKNADSLNISSLTGTENPFFYAHRRFSLMSTSKFPDALTAGGFMQKNTIGHSEGCAVNWALRRILQG